jgi:hypothetical protein
VPATVFPNYPVGSKLYWYTGSGYAIEEVVEQIGPPPDFIVTTNWSPGTNTLVVGEGFWLKIPAAAPQPSYTASLMGEVPGALTIPSNTVALPPGLSLVGYSYPVDVLWTSTTAAAQAKLGDKVYVWTGSGYSINELVEQIGPPPDFPVTTNWNVPGMTINAGQGMWYKNTGAQTNLWLQTKPYTWP